MTNRDGYIIRQQLAIEIFPDEYGDVVLRQGDAVITVRATNIALLVDFLVHVANDDDDSIDDGGINDVEYAPESVRSAADRARKSTNDQCRTAAALSRTTP